MIYKEVQTLNGQLRGSVLKSVDGFDFCAFKGIPYAKPPLAELRFQDPVPADKWQGIRDALEFGPISVQHDMMMTNVTGGSEDCLYLNVYAKSIESTNRRPVMVWIHGGGFAFGSGDDNTFYGPDYFMKKDVVLVTINYRLGVFGFLNLQDKVAPGNQGLKDQVMALRWVHDNIANFGGDPENVTIFGESAGGACVHFLTLSPLAKGLFHKAISQSGTVLNPWASVHKDPKLQAYKLCELLGKKIRNPKEIVQFLRTIDAMKLLEAQKKLMSKNIKKCCLSFCPGMDDESPNPFLPMPVTVAAQEGAHVPYMIGHTDREGTFFLKINESLYDYETRDEPLEELLHPKIIEILKNYNLTLSDLKKMYFKSEPITQERSEKLIDMIGDIMIVHGVQKVIKIQVECNSAPTYMYQFTYDKGHTFAKYMSNSDAPGATHFDDLIYLFYMKFWDKLNLKSFKKQSKNYRVMEQIIELWTNFAKYGRPTPTVSELVPVYWQPVIDGTVLRYMNIGEELRMEKTLNIEERFNYKKNNV